MPPDDSIRITHKKGTSITLSPEGLIKKQREYDFCQYTIEKKEDDGEWKKLHQIGQTFPGLHGEIEDGLSYMQHWKKNWKNWFPEKELRIMKIPEHYTVVSDEPIEMKEDEENTQEGT